MALVHRVKTTHSYAATPKHFADFFSTLTHMYEEQTHTDVHLVSSEGTIFGVHRVSHLFKVLKTSCHSLVVVVADGVGRSQCFPETPVSTRGAMRVQHADCHPSGL